MEVRIGNPDGELLGTIRVPRTGGEDRWALRTIDITKLTGVHDICFIVKGKPQTNLMHFDYWLFSR